jgi:diguanylate cyclase
MNSSPRARILCVDDEAEVLKGLALHLGRRYELLTSTDGPAALDLLRRHQDVAVIMADMRMPGMNGAEFLAESRKVAPDAQRILLTGETDLSSAIAAVNEGQICRFLTKPCPPPVLLDAIAAAVRLHRGHDLQREAIRKRLEHEHLQVDALTGLVSRRQLLGQLEAAVYDPSGVDSTLAAFFVEVDATDGPVDDRDMPWGDEVAIIIANRLKDVFTRGEVLARWGIDQFVITLRGPAVTDSELRAGAQALLEVLNEPIVSQQHVEKVRVSIGIARLVDKSQWQRLIQQASLAAREAYSAGGCGVCLYRYDSSSRAEAQRTMLRALRQAITEESLQLHYQPIIDIRGRRVHGLECLLRWTHATLGAIPPSTFVPLAEQSGDILALGKWVLWRACHEGLALVRDYAVRLAVNVSPLQLNDPTFLPHLQECLAHSGMAPDCLELEITETALAGDLQRLRQTLNLVRDLGVRISIDDFGTGYSSLAYIAQLPVDLIKVDGVFVRDFSNGGAAVVRAACGLAADLGRELVVEGVETDEMLAQLETIGGTLFQGYLFARPMPAPEIAMWITRFQHVGTNVGYG